MDISHVVFIMIKISSIERPCMDIPIVHKSLIKIGCDNFLDALDSNQETYLG